MAKKAQKYPVAIIAAIIVFVGLLVLYVIKSNNPYSEAGGKNTATGIISVTPNPVSSGTQVITITGTNFKANTDIMVGPRGVIPTVTLKTDAYGSFTTAYTPWDGAFVTLGTYFVEARSTNRKGTLLGSTTFSVQ